MIVRLNTAKWYERLAAAFILYTRIPVSVFYKPDIRIFRKAIEYWPLTGWVTGGIAAAIIFFGSMIVPPAVAVGIAVIARLLLTKGASPPTPLSEGQEGSLRRFADAFVRGKTPGEVISLMQAKTVSICGSVTLLVYFVVLVGSLSVMPPPIAALALLAADPYSKMISGQLVMMLPYAWPDEEGDNGYGYEKFGTVAGIILFLQGIVPLAVMLYMTRARWDLLVFVPCLTMYFLYLLMWNRLKGYNGHCLSAIALLTELAFLITAATPFVTSPTPFSGL